MYVYSYIFMKKHTIVLHRRSSSIFSSKSCVFHRRQGLVVPKKNKSDLVIDQTEEEAVARVKSLRSNPLIAQIKILFGKEKPDVTVSMDDERRLGTELNVRQIKSFVEDISKEGPFKVVTSADAFWYNPAFQNNERTTPLDPDPAHAPAPSGSIEQPFRPFRDIVLGV